MSKIILKNAVERKRNWLYYIDWEGNLCGYDMLKRRNKLKTQKGELKND